MRWGLVIVFIAVIGIGGWLAYTRVPTLENWLQEKGSSGVATLEIRVTPEEIMEAHRTELIKTQAHTYLEPELDYAPYLWMDVKYAKSSDNTVEGIALWDLVEGELVLDGNTWEKTHGYEDCLLAKADAIDFTILNAVAEQGGTVLRETLYQICGMDSHLLDRAITNCQKKKLLLVKGDLLRLHFNCPKLASVPLTSLSEGFVSAPGRIFHRESKRYSLSQITKLAENAFGTDFTIRRTKEVFVPIYTISVQNPDGSVLKTKWNALTGKRLQRN